MTPLSAFARSLQARLLAIAVALSVMVLAALGVWLAGQYRDSAMRALDSDLQVVLDSLVADADVGAGGAIALDETPNDSRFNTPGSGRYWQIAPWSASAKPDPVQQSASLWDEASLPWPPEGAAALLARPGRTSFANAMGPFDQPVRLATQLVQLPGMETPVAFFAAADRRPALADAERFSRTLYLALGALALGLAGMVAWQVSVGLAPLRRLRDDVAEVRRGKRARLEGEYPTEVTPLADELNALLDHNRAVVERARTHVGNLAHALKTPISVLLNEARGQQGQLADLVTRQADAMSRNVDHYLQRAQAAARAETAGARCEVRPVLDDITRTLARLYGRERDIDIEVVAGPAPVFRGERQDLEEMAGNLMENACKYGGGTVRVTLGERDRKLSVTIEDDGPGLAEAARTFALQRGVRLDETTPGQGLGLSIVAELARLYGGDLSLGASDLGGLKAELTLPATD